MERGIVSAIYSRHHQGTVRQRHLESLLAIDEAWVVPFVIQLVGEYVLEIVEVVAANRHVLDGAHYRAFAADNAAFIARTRQRAASYWNCYHRDRFARARDYPGIQLLRACECSGPGRAHQGDARRHRGKGG